MRNRDFYVAFSQSPVDFINAVIASQVLLSSPSWSATWRRQQPSGGASASFYGRSCWDSALPCACSAGLYQGVACANGQQDHCKAQSRELRYGGGGGGRPSNPITLSE